MNEILSTKKNIFPDILLSSAKTINRISNTVINNNIEDTTSKNENVLNPATNETTNAATNETNTENNVFQDKENKTIKVKKYMKTKKPMLEEL